MVIYHQCSRLPPCRPLLDREEAEEEGETARNFRAVSPEPVPEKGRVVDHAASYVGVSGRTLEKATPVDEVYCYLAMAVGGTPSSINSFLWFSLLH